MRKLILFGFIVCMHSLYAQSISSLNDSIRKYAIQDPKKALDFGYQAISTSDFNKLSWDVYDTNFNFHFSKLQNISYFSNRQNFAIFKKEIFI